MIAVIGLIMFAVSSYLALSKKMHLMVPFVVVPVIAGLFCGFSLPEVLNFAAEGVTGTFNSVLLCIFAVLYFSVLSETGMFDIMVNRLVGITRGNIYIVMVVTVLVAFIGHLDGAYNTTYLIAIPALAPLYKRLNIDRRSLVLLVSLAAAPMTAMAWGQPAKMTVFDPSIDPVVMASSLYPVVAIMLGLAVVTSLGFGYYYSKKNASEIALLRKSFENGGGSQKVDFSDNPLARPKLFWANFALFLGSLACFMFMTGVKTYVLFMVFSCAALLLNYHTQKEQSQIIRKHSATMLAPAILFLGIGIMVGILNGTGMVTAMVDAVLGIVPYETDCFYEDETPIVMGDVAIRTRLSAGHTPGTTSFFVEMKDEEGKTVVWGMHGGVGINTMNTDYLQKVRLPLSLQEDFFRGCEEMKSIHVDICTPSHPSHSDMLERIQEDRNDYRPFVDEGKWPAFLEERAESLRKVLERGVYQR